MDNNPKTKKDPTTAFRMFNSPVLGAKWGPRSHMTRKAQRSPPRPRIVWYQQCTGVITARQEHEYALLCLRTYSTRRGHRLRHSQLVEGNDIVWYGARLEC